MTTDPAADYCRRQIALADTGRADNQCPSCRVYRTDGKKPQPSEHRTGCAYSGVQPILTDAGGTS